MKTVTLGFSPCPNDTFIFDALVNNRLRMDFIIDPVIRDVEALNAMAIAGDLDVTKISFAAYPAVSEKYQILSSGAALGHACGPLIIAKETVDWSEIENCEVAIPGQHTTANMLLSTFFPKTGTRKEVLFSQVEEEVLSGNSRLGLIIHENRFTYLQKGLVKIADLGEIWEKEFQLPVPLGCIVVRRCLPDSEKVEIQRLIRESVSHAFSHPEDSADFVQQHAQEMDPEIRKMHIDLYVNQFSLDLGEEGREAIQKLFEVGCNSGLFHTVRKPFFVENYTEKI